MKLFHTLALFSAVVLTAMSAKAQDTTQTLPNIEIKDLNGNTVKVNELGNGKLTVISFWATWCGPCIKELDNVADVYPEWQEKFGAQVIAVSIDDARNSLKVKPVAKGHGWDYQILLDENKQFFTAMNGTNPPLTFVVSPAGHIVYTHQGYVEGAELELEKFLKEYTGKE